MKIYISYDLEDHNKIRSIQTLGQFLAMGKTEEQVDKRVAEKNKEVGFEYFRAIEVSDEMEPVIRFALGENEYKVYSNITDVYNELKNIEADLDSIRENVYHMSRYVEDTIKKVVEVVPDEEMKVENNHPYVDLGLSVKWATCNVGATNPNDYGDYFAWGETETKDEYTEENCKTCAETMSDISGDARHDVARAKWGGSWRIPTNAEMGELKNMCQWEWTDVNGVGGYKVTGPNGNSIFLPAAGCRECFHHYDNGFDGYYWSSTPHDGCNDRYTYILDFDDESQGVGWGNRYYGQSVRPVLDV